MPAPLAGSSRNVSAGVSPTPQSLAAVPSEHETYLLPRPPRPPDSEPLSPADLRWALLAAHPHFSSHSVQPFSHSLTECVQSLGCREGILPRGGPGHFWPAQNVVDFEKETVGLLA